MQKKFFQSINFKKIDDPSYIEEISSQVGSEQITELSAQVFDQKLPNNPGGGTYTDVLSAEEETVLIAITLSKAGHEADPWLEFIQRYNRTYPFSNKAIDVLFKNLENPKSIPLLIDLLSAHGYNESQGLALCDIVLKDNNREEALRLLQLIYGNCHFFSPDIYRRLETIDSRISELGYTEQAHFAESYQQAVESYRQSSKK